MNIDVRLRILVAMVLALSGVTGCANNREALHALADGEREQTRLLEERNALLEQQTELLARSIESQQQMVEMLSDVDRSLRDLRREAAETREGEPETAPADLDAEPFASEPGKTVVGRIEWAWVDLLQRNLKARVDTGALSASLSATELQPFERDGDEWIRFRVPDEEHPDGGEMYETPLVGHVLIRQASAEEVERRPVVRLRLRVGELVDEIEFSLTNRENMNYPLLLGRDFLRDVAVVDVSRKFTQEKYLPEVVPETKDSE